MAFVIRSTLIVATLVVALSVTCSGQCAASSDPFGNQTVQVAYSPLVEEWFAIIRKLDRGHTLLAVCVDSTVTGCAAARQLHDIVEDAKAQNGLALIGHINRAVNFVIKPVTPSGWLSPLEAINSGGDCKAFSIAKYFALLEAGIAADHLRLVIVHARSGNHMVVAALWQDRWFILDNLTLVLVPDALSDYVPLLVLDDKGVRSYVVTPANY